MVKKTDIIQITGTRTQPDHKRKLHQLTNRQYWMLFHLVILKASSVRRHILLNSSADLFCYIGQNKLANNAMIQIIMLEHRYTCMS